MLKARILTACVLIPSVIAAILYLSSQPFMLLSGAVFLVAAWEWTRLAGFKKVLGRILCCLLMILTSILLLVLVYQGFGHYMALQEGIFILVPLFWCVALIGVVLYPKYTTFWKSRAMGILSGCMVLLPSWGFLNALQSTDPKLVFYVLTLVCTVDSAAYFVGKRYGRTKLAPNLSPGKSWEGVLGGLAVGFLVVGVGYVLIKPTLSIPHWMLLSAVVMIFSIVGDLFESLFKRLRGLKNSGSILPGHGGILDRLDSINAAIPLFTLGVMLLG